MIHKKIIANRKRLIRPSLVIALFLSVFSFGLGVYNPQQKQIAKTELVGSARHIVKRTHSLKKEISVQTKIVPLQLHTQQFKVAIFHYAQFIKIRFAEASAKALFIKRSIGVFDRSHITRSSDEDNSNSTRG